MIAGCLVELIISFRDQPYINHDLTAPGATVGWYVERKDGAQLVQGLPTRESAIAWVNDHYSRCWRAPDGSYSNPSAHPFRVTIYPSQPAPCARVKRACWSRWRRTDALG